jgi:hypothetical protein
VLCDDRTEDKFTDQLKELGINFENLCKGRNSTKIIEIIQTRTQTKICIELDDDFTNFCLLRINNEIQQMNADSNPKIN